VPHDGPPDENTGRAWSDAELRDLSDMLLIGVSTPLPEASPGVA
jgi:hypothetical protein